MTVTPEAEKQNLMKMNSKFLQFPIFVLFLIAPGCEKAPQPRHYEEVFIDGSSKAIAATSDPHAFMGEMPQDEIHANIKRDGMNMDPRLAASVVNVPLKWAAPDGWVEEPGSGMRLASFSSKDKMFPIETTIISLAGMAGGVSSNVERWIQQIGIPLPPESELNRFIAQQEVIKTKGGLSLVLIDFTQLQEGNGLEAPSMAASIIDHNDYKIFIKMTGSKEAVLKNKDLLKSLVQSIEIAQPK